MINQDVLNLNVFCGDRDILNTINVKEKESCATNGDMMGMVSNPTNDDSEYPTHESKEFVKEARIKAKTAKNFKILKAKYKKNLENIVLLKKENSDNVILYNTNLETAQSVEEIQEAGTYPDIKECMPSGEPRVEITLNINYLKAMMDYLSKFDTRKLPVVKMSVYNKNAAVKFECAIPNQKQFTGLVMPTE